MHEAVNTLIKLHSLVGKEDLINKLLELMQSKNERLQITSINALDSLDRTKIMNKGILNKLLEFVECEDEGLQLAVIQALLSVPRKMGGDERLGIEKKLLKLVYSKNEEIPSEAIHLLIRKAREEGIGGELINNFLELISSENEKVRLAAAYGLSDPRHLQDKVSREKVIKDLFKLVDDENEKIQDAAVAALSGSVGEESVANMFLELMDSKSEIVRVRAICAMIGYADFGNVKVHSFYSSKKRDKKKFVNKLWVAVECESERVQAAAL